MNRQSINIPDGQARRKALDPERSFIVQAPAGSGKTGLLIQRYLSLLSRVRSPEEIIAITFTRKAAAEMKERVLLALQGAGSDDPPEEAHESLTWELAREVRRQDAAGGWNIMQNPSRLRISTIDSFCASLNFQMPILSGLGIQPEIMERAAPLYREAAANTVMELESAGDWSDAVEALIRHMDNHIGRVEELIAEMLSRRDQWLRHVVDASDMRIQRENLENALCRVIESALRNARLYMPEAVVRRLPEAARFAAKNLFAGAPGSGICACLEMWEIPECIPDELGTWHGIAELLLTKTGDFRKTADKRIGFPTGPDRPGGGNPDKAYFARQKSGFKGLLSEISGCREFAEALHAVRVLPEPYYTEEQWRLVEALFGILKLSVAHLHLVFEKYGGVDFTEVALRASSALGDTEAPTDLALLLDYGIHHILVDEFQDTSISQFELFLKLTAGWTPGDGKTFFAVGDPMQSIYSFREAEVGLFLKAWESGLGPHLPLERLTLCANFRSGKGIVDWVNRTFAAVFPEKNDLFTGAVAYSPSEAVHPEGDSPAIGVYPVIEGGEDRAAETVVDCILAARRNDPQGTIAILVRSRSHLKKILPGLRRAKIRYRAVEIESLGQRPVISDLTAISRALSHPADRVAWLGLLRAPWCGLSLDDLFALAGKDHENTIYDLTGDLDRLSRLSEDGRMRLERIRPVLTGAMEKRGRQPLRWLVEKTWTALGGPACVTEADICDASVYFDLLESRINGAVMTDYQSFEEEIRGLFSRPDPEAGDLLQVMTIHKAKGLEFETVILPGLEKAPRGDTDRLLLWQEIPDDELSRAGLLLAPIAETGTGKDPTYRYIKTLHMEKNAHETRRLLYVAATRARKRLMMVGCVNRMNTGEAALPDSRSLLHSLWPAVEEIFLSTCGEKGDAVAGEGAGVGVSSGGLPGKDATGAFPYIRRLSSRWKAPLPPGDIGGEDGNSAISMETADADDLKFDWAGITVRMTGTVVHRWLRIICETGIDRWDIQRVSTVSGQIRADLIGMGMGKDASSEATDMVVSALRATLADKTGRWLLSPHRGGKCEYPLCGLIDSRMVYVVIDRTFIDEKGTRWIVDYKSGIHRGGGIEEFMARERMRYDQQTARYAALMEKKEPGRQVLRALYFPMFSGWSVWPRE